MSIQDRLKKYLKKKRRDFPDVFHYRNWKSASIEEKMCALQLLENSYAKKQGRTPCVVELANLPPNVSGQYDGKTIVINRLELENPTNNSSCVDTILHEGRHAYQKESVNGTVLHNNAEELQKWVENHSFYFPGSTGFRYYFQAIERDAFSYAYVETKKLFDSLEKDYGQDQCWSDYENNLKAAHDFYAKSAHLFYGPKFIEKIDTDIAEEYRVEQTIRQWQQPNQRTEKGLTKTPRTINQFGSR